MWDLLGISWSYEAIDLAGYIPDFLLGAEVFSTPQMPGPVLVEVRPAMRPEEFRPVIDEIARSGWTGSAMVVGLDIPMRESIYGRESIIGAASPCVSRAHADPGSDEWYGVGWHVEANRIGFGGDDLTRTWREAGNRAQWMPLEHT